MENGWRTEDDVLDFFSPRKNQNSYHLVYTVAIEDDELVVKHRSHGTSKLKSAWGDNFRADFWFMRSVEFLRDDKGGIEGFSVTQWQSRNHVFSKMGTQQREPVALTASLSVRK